VDGGSFAICILGMAAGEEGDNFPVTYTYKMGISLTEHFVVSTRVFLVYQLPKAMKIIGRLEPTAKSPLLGYK
jgi:hypothetical protein